LDSFGQAFDLDLIPLALHLHLFELYLVVAVIGRHEQLPNDGILAVYLDR
jgi:hypothetical protein